MVALCGVVWRGVVEGCGWTVWWRQRGEGVEKHAPLVSEDMEPGLQGVTNALRHHVVRDFKCV